MKLTIWLMILTFTVGAGTSQSIDSTSTSSERLTREGKVATNCWINGVWYNPCPSDYQPPPDPEPTPGPETLLP